ncbi:protoporphyrinogen oxidase [Paenibacillus xylaniclasticus]|uniref:protoporphyrinogen oxidase n=1 Tax=Paenibacillus xylaniclasticus TaxID=588083 RepID=UPI000FD96887|nr:MULTISPECIES: protoporphyrinogen oxidase [Paenibacillus]GFN33923.1 protoporphyrinogen oxidase [Paenibacillus curdlanolyticus]
MTTIVIIGGGITGMSTAYYLNQYTRGIEQPVRLIVIEGSSELGGKISTVRQGEYIIESGADSIVSRKTNMEPLLEELGLKDELVYNATGKSYIHVDGQLKLIPSDSLFGIPMTIESLASSTLVSAEGKVEALKDFYTPNTTFTENDSIGRFLEAFLGKEMVDKQIAPVLSGVYSGDLRELTIASTLPYLLKYKNEYGSIMKGLEANRGTLQKGGDRKFYSFANGLSTLIERMEERLAGDVALMKGVRADRIERISGHYGVVLENGETVEADHIVISTLHPTAQTLLSSDDLNADFAELRNSSLISVYIGFDVPDESLPADGTGFITADSSELVCNACTWTSRKWEHTSASRRLLVRLFYKSSKPAYERLSRMTDAELLEVAVQDVKAAMGIDAKPIHYDVRKWHDTMPNYHIRHPHIVASLERKMEELFPNVLLAGCSYYGVGIPDCVANGERTARRIADRITLSHDS